MSDPLGTVRVCDRFGTIAVYVKVGEDKWHIVYVDPRSGDHLVPKGTTSDRVACGNRTWFRPSKSVAGQYE